MVIILSKSSIVNISKAITDPFEINRHLAAQVMSEAILAVTQPDNWRMNSPDSN